MNYLAHAYLSFGHPGILTGNMISDFVKGKKKFEYPTEVQQGIALHREIDCFTDSHEATKEAKEYFRPDYRLYSGAFIDVVYDHFLANDPTVFSEATLFDFSRRTYATLDEQAGWMPERFAHMFAYMKQQNWLYNYHTRWGIKKSFGGLVRRATYLDDSDAAFEVFEKQYQPLGDCYRHFWAALKPFAENKFQELSGNKI